jgi:hypothetical protein
MALCGFSEALRVSKVKIPPNFAFQQTKSVNSGFEKINWPYAIET